MNKDKRLAALAVVAIFIAAIVGGAIGYAVIHWPKIQESVNGWIHGSHTTTVTATPAVQGGESLSLPIYFSVMGPNGPISSATIYVYNTNGVLIWSGATSTNGVISTDPMLFTSGQTILILVKGPDGGYVSLEKTLPYYTAAQAQTQKYHMISINYVPLGTFSVAMFAGGTQYTSGNVTLSASTPNNVQIQVINTKLGSGAAPIIDPKTGDHLSDYVIIHANQSVAIGSTAVNVIKVTFGQDVYYIVPINPSALYKDVKGNGGLATIPITISKATATSPVSLTVTFVAYGDLHEFENSGTWGDYASTTSETFNLIFS